MKNQYLKATKPLFSHERAGERYTYSLLTLRDGSSSRYGLQVRLILGEEEYEAHTGPLFLSRAAAVRFLCALCRHLVTPSNLPYLIEDILSDFD